MQKVIDVHTEEFGSQPEIVVKSPCLFDIMGERAWFFNDESLSMAVDMPLYVALSKRTDNVLRFYYYQQKERKKIPLSITKLRKEDKLANTVKAVLLGYENLGYKFSGFDVTFYSELLPNVGLGITNSFKVATAFAIKKLLKIRGNDTLLLQVLEFADKQFFDTGFFVSDVNTILFSKKNSCVLTTNAGKSYEVLPFNYKGMSIILTDAKIPRASMWNENSIFTEQNKKLLACLKIQRNSKIIYEDSLSEINDVFSRLTEDTRRRLISLMKENQTLLDGVDALRNSNFNRFAKSVNKSHELMRDAYSISCPEIDWLVKRVQELDLNNLPNVSTCSRITGRDFAHFTFSIMKDEFVESYMQKLQDYERIFGFHPTTYIVHPSEGISVMKDTGV